MTHDIISCTPYRIHIYLGSFVKQNPAFELPSSFLIPRVHPLYKPIHRDDLGPRGYFTWKPNPDISWHWVTAMNALYSPHTWSVNIQIYWVRMKSTTTIPTHIYVCWVWCVIEISSSFSFHKTQKLKSNRSALKTDEIIFQNFTNEVYDNNFCDLIWLSVMSSKRYDIVLHKFGIRDWHFV